MGPWGNSLEQIDFIPKIQGFHMGIGETDGFFSENTNEDDLSSWRCGIFHNCRTREVLGEKGRRIRELTALVQKRFGFPECLG